MNKFLDAEIQFNLASRPNWESGAPHREQVTRHLLDLSRNRQGRLCVLGAGNSNDLDLKRLREVYSEVHLVDLDQSALEFGVQNQGIESDPQIFCHVREITGAAEQLAASAEAGHGVSLLIEQFSQAPELNLPGPFDVVCSTCILSQLVLQVVNAVGDTQPDFDVLLATLRGQHFQTVLELMNERGAGLVVSDFVSSESAADLKSVPDFQFTQYLSQLLSSHNFFHGVHPGLLFAQLQGDAPLAHLVQNVEMLPPWRWDLGARQYAVAALRFERRTES